MTFIPIYKLTGSANFGKVLPMKVTSYSSVQFIFFTLLLSTGGGGGGGGGGSKNLE